MKKRGFLLLALCLAAALGLTACMPTGRMNELPADARGTYLHPNGVHTIEFTANTVSYPMIVLSTIEGNIPISIENARLESIVSAGRDTIAVSWTHRQYFPDPAGGTGQNLVAPMEAQIRSDGSVVVSSPVGLVVGRFVRQ